MEVEKPWYKNGLHFKCTGCGACCTGTDGYVFIAPSDIKELASHFNLSERDFSKKYTRKVGTQTALIDKDGSGDCIFLENNQCKAYGARPVQCRTFPFWDNPLRTPEDWEETAKSCEGINHASAPLLDLDHIEKEKKSYLKNVLEQNFLP